VNRTAVIVTVLLLGVGILALRQTTMSVHGDVPTDSHLDVWISADTLVPEDPATRLARSQVDLCTAEAVPFSDLTSFLGTEAVSDPAEQLPVYRFRLQPGADEPDRAQLRGCLEDLRIRHLRLNVLGLRQVVGGETTEVEGRTP
jgi:hypothetical protein